MSGSLFASIAADCRLSVWRLDICERHSAPTPALVLVACEIIDVDDPLSLDVTTVAGKGVLIAVAGAGLQLFFFPQQKVEALLKLS